jgi:hypothetical protein
MKAFKSGEQVPTSGIYMSLHSIPHRLPEREMYSEGSRFPECRICPGGASYRLESPCVPTAMPASAHMATAVC